MGVCLAVTKVIGTSSLGIYTGIVFSNISNYDILMNVLKTTNFNFNSFNEFNNKLNHKLKEHCSILFGLGSISSILFQLTYFKSPLNLKHPYLIYSSLVLPISLTIYGILFKNEIINYFKLNEISQRFKQSRYCCGGLKKCGAKEEQKTNNESKKEQITSELDNSVYKDLGDEINSNDESNSTPTSQIEDEEISKEVEVHLNKTITEGLLNKLNLANKIISGFSLVGFIISCVGIYGDF